MKSVTSRYLVLAVAALLGLTLIAAGPNAPAAARDSFRFNLSSDYGDSDTSADFTVLQAGCILAQIPSWTASGSIQKAEELSLVLYGPDTSGYYARSDGSASSIVPLWTSYAAQSSDVGSLDQWRISVFNFSKSGTAQGTVSFEYPPTPMPCEFRAAISRDRTSGKVVLSWRYTGVPFRSSSFLVERSTNGRQWSVVRDCAQEFSSQSDDYACADNGLTSGATYYYRACTTPNTDCTGIDATTTPPVSIQAP
ncbi:MAG: hypothetical protein HS126_07450 [Anaerolineales bacterium]|nr:hypothetical protein [Anaerolineales bacterium]